MDELGTIVLEDVVSVVEGVVALATELLLGGTELVEFVDVLYSLDGAAQLGAAELEAVGTLDVLGMLDELVSGEAVSVKVRVSVSVPVCGA